jgi:hypothetical protein
VVKEIKRSEKSGARYLNIELALQGGDYHNRRVFGMISDPWDTRVSDDGRAMSVGAITRILEACGVFDHNNIETYGQLPAADEDGEAIQHLAELLNGQAVAIRVGIKKGENGYQDRNNVAEWLSPNPKSNGNKNWELLMSGVTNAASAQKAVPAAPAAFGGAKPAAAAPAVTGLKTPAFLRKQ